LKPKLLVVELWGLGDLVIATPFLRAASERFEVTLLSKPFGQDLRDRFWPEVKVVPFLAPWTSFKQKYRLLSWPWREILKLQRQLAGAKFDLGISARWDPRDHFLLALLRTRQRVGYPRVRSGMFLTRSLTRPAVEAHHYSYWQILGTELGLEMPNREQLSFTSIPPTRRRILFHTGAGQPVRVWPLGKASLLLQRLRAAGHKVQIACDPNQESVWHSLGERDVAVPRSVPELLKLIDRAAAFIGNDSGPGHLAALAGVPTFTFFGSQLPEWFAPLHPGAEWIEGKSCPYKPCSDYCRFSRPFCLEDLPEEAVWQRLQPFLQRQFGLKI